MMDRNLGLKDRLTQTGLRQAIRLASRNPKRNIPILINIARQFASYGRYLEALNRLDDRIQRDPNVLRKAKLAVKNPKIVAKFVENWALNSLFLTGPIRRQRVEQGKPCPTVVLLDPTSACNLNCDGCWAGEYEQSDRLNPKRFDALLQEMKDIGIYWTIFSGGEPLLYPHLIDLMKKHNDMAFMAFTNGTLLDANYADALEAAGNFSPVFSLEGGRHATDGRRGEGVFDRVIQAMDRCRDRGIPFGVSLTATRDNIDEIVSDDFVQFLDEKGCVYIWIFHYMPIGRDPDFELMLTPQQREDLAHRSSELRGQYPMLIIDFWNDGPLIDGCIAGGRVYLHINAAGDVEPCAFVHVATHNINEVSFEEALESPLLEAFRKHQPFSKNHYAPCPLIDNPETLRDIVKESGAEGTHPGAEAILKGENARQLDRIAKTWHAQSEALFQNQPEDFWEPIRSPEVTKSNNDN